MEGDVGVERDEEVDDGGAQVGDGVATHGQQEEGEGEGHGGGRASRQTDAVTHQQPQGAVLSLHRVDCRCHAQGQRVRDQFTCNVM